MKDIFILIVLIMFTSFHLGRCVTTYMIYAMGKKNNWKINYFRNNYIEIVVLLIGIVAIVIDFL